MGLNFGNIASIAAPIAGGIFGGPVGAAAGAGVAGLLNQPEMPASPDYMSLAQQQFEQQQQLNQQNTAANRPNQFTPYGSSIWTQDPNNPYSWANKISLSPEQQQLFNQQQANQGTVLDLSGQLAGGLGSTLTQPFTLPGTIPTYAGNTAPLPTYGDAKQQVMNAMLGRVNTQYGQDVDKMKASLAARGIPPGSEAYNREMDTLNRQLTDARQQAELNATQQAGADYSSALAGRQQTEGEALNKYNTGMQGYQQQIQNMLTQRNQPLLEYNALNTGNPVTTPNFNNFAYSTPTNAPDIMNAAQNNYSNAINQYNATQGANNAFVNAGANVAGAYLNSQNPTTVYPAGTNNPMFQPVQPRPSANTIGFTPTF